jgi:hypothetical protein
LAKLQYESIREATNPSEIRSTLEILPQDLKALYLNALGRIDQQAPQRAKLAKRILLWLSYTKRPLTSLELQHALAIERGKSIFEKENMAQTSTMVAVCLGLVVVDHETDTIRLVHSTVQEFIKSLSHESVSDGDAIIAETCLTYLCYDHFETLPSSNIKNSKYNSLAYPFISYASVNWPRHIDRNSEQSLSPAILKLLRNKILISSASMEAWRCGREIDSPKLSAYHRNRSGLHVAARYNFPHIIQLLLQEGQYIEEKDEYGWTPLMEAVHFDNTSLFEPLIKLGASLFTMDDRPKPVFHYISKEILKQLEKSNLLDEEGLKRIYEKKSVGKNSLSGTARSGPSRRPSQDDRASVRLLTRN